MKATQRGLFGVLANSLLAQALTCYAATTAEDLSVHIKPDEKDNFGIASFYLRVPKKIEAPSYILVLLPGYNADGARMVNDTNWLAFAEETRGAIVACTFKSIKKKKGHYVHYAAAQHGSGAALESAISKLDEKDSRHSLGSLPLLIYGYSAGGQFAYGFSCHNPNRMVGFAALKGGYYFPKPIEGTHNVPGLVVSGQKDLARRRKSIRDLFESHRMQGAPWCWMEDSGGHGAGGVLSVVIPFFRELLRMQLVEEGKGLPDRSRLSGIFVDLQKKRILSENTGFDAKERNPRHGWLPSKAVFEQWSLLDTGMLKYSEQTPAERLLRGKHLTGSRLDNRQLAVGSN